MTYNDWYEVWSFNTKTYERCIYGTYNNPDNALKVAEEMTEKCPDEEYSVKQGTHQEGV